MRYVPTTSAVQDDERGQAEHDVWTALRASFNDQDDGILYHQYPIFDRGGHRFDEKPDFVLLHRNLGLVVIECVHHTFDKIERITDGTWYLRWADEEKREPLLTGRDKCVFLQDNMSNERVLRSGTSCKLSATALVALPNIDSREWEHRGLDNQFNTSSVILSDDLSPKSLRAKLNSTSEADGLTEPELEAARNVLSGGQPISESYDQPPEKTTTRGEYYQQVEKGLKGLDEQQQRIGMQVPPGPQQIRGIAGSGKTILLAMKAARIAADPKFNDWNVALTFNTKTLYPALNELIKRYYEWFANEPFEEPLTNLEILHGWGGKVAGPGVYYRIANQIEGQRPRTYPEAKDLYEDESDGLEAIARELLDTAEIPTLWDAVLVDEAQDFGEHFFKMCLESLDENNRLIWGYDEAQDLGNLTAPSPKQVFGTDEEGEPVVDMRGSYEGGIQKSIIMRKSYRAPRQVLMTAHALGMGLKRREGPLQTITRADGWKKVGYEVEGDFREIGSRATIIRPTEYSPHPLQDESGAAPFVEIEWFPGRYEELRYVANMVERDVREQGLDPEQVMIVLLGNTKDRYGTKVLEEIESRNLRANRVWEGNKKEFDVSNEVTLTGVYRAKGNEAASVYVLGIDQVANHNYNRSEVRRRNHLFVATTRSRSWCTLTGVKTPMLRKEFDRVLEDVQSTTPSLTFRVPDPTDLRNCLEEDTEGLEVTKLSDFVNE